MKIEPYHLNPDWYRVKYNLAAHCVDAGLDQRSSNARDSRPDAAEDQMSDASGDFQQAADHARELSLAAATTIRWTTFRRRGSHRELYEFLRGIVEPAAVALLAGVLLLTEGSADGQVVRLTDRRRLIRALSRLATAPQSVTPGALIQYAAREPISYRVGYNLACHYSLAELVRPRADASNVPTAWQAGPTPTDDERLRFSAWAFPQGSNGEPPDPLAISERYLYRALTEAPPVKRDELSNRARSDPALSSLRARGAGTGPQLPANLLVRGSTAARSGGPELRDLLEAVEHNGWSLDVAQRLWAHVQADGEAGRNLSTPQEWSALLDSLDVPSEPDPPASNTKLRRA